MKESEREREREREREQEHARESERESKSVRERLTHKRSCGSSVASVVESARAQPADSRSSLFVSHPPLISSRPPYTDRDTDTQRHRDTDR